MPRSRPPLTPKGRFRATATLLVLLPLWLAGAGCASLRVNETAPARPPAVQARKPRVALLGLRNTGPVPYFVETQAAGAIYGAGPEMDRLLLRNLAEQFAARGWEPADPVETARAAARARRGSSRDWTPESLRAAGETLKADVLVVGDFDSRGRSVLTLGRRLTRLNLRVHEARTGREMRALSLVHRDWFFLLINFKTNDQIARELAAAAGRAWPAAPTPPPEAP